jgi:N-succinyl-L-ornithine transcarbamylase
MMNTKISGSLNAIRSTSEGRRKFTCVQDVYDVDALVNKALEYKSNPLSDRHLGAGKRIGLLFLNPSMRTRLSTQIAAGNLGMEAIVFNVDKEGWALEFQDGVIMDGASTEHIKDAAPVLGGYFDILAIRSFPALKNQEKDYADHYLSQFIKYCGRPVISLESATLHPLQSLADLITIREIGNKSLTQKIKPKIVLTWAPHVKPLPQCVANSFAEWMNTWGEAEFVITHPPGYALAERFTKGAEITFNQDAALRDADFIYVKNWSSYQDYGKIIAGYADWMLTREKMKACPHAKLMHCMPLRRNVELSDEVLDSKNSLLTQQAGNRVWAAQAVISELLSENE